MTNDLTWRLHDLREDSDYSQAELADLVGVAQTTYSGYETGARNVPNEILIRLAQIYHTSTDYLLGLTDEKQPYARNKRDPLKQGSKK